MALAQEQALKKEQVLALELTLEPQHYRY